ncbi:MAG TPA: RNA polymerase sigma factor SigJ, partial [Gemmatimonadales bacterium]|nr:RNA polymerase sigma factor SigJ [Gemmatimonadales bacterium]
PRLFGIAYRMLGLVEDAEDVVQESYLRWHATDPAVVRNAEAWLVAVTTRIAIDRLRRLTTEREAYLGTWLPEPIGTSAGTPADRHAELVSDLSMAFLVMLERLGPEERAAFLLREVFDAGYDEIARVLERSEAACRQLVHRARERVRGERARFSVPAETRERLLERLLAALERGDRRELLALVAPNATWDSDGGGKVSATRRTVRGADRIVRMLLGFERKGRDLVRHNVTWVNGEPAIVTHAGDRLLFTTSVATDGEQLLAFYRVLNPDKLRHLALFRDSAWSGEDA